MSTKPGIRIDSLDGVKESAGLKQPGADDAESASREFVQKAAKVFCDIAIHAWRAQRRLKDRVSGEVKEEHRAIHRSVSGIFDSLMEIGFQVRDREGEPYNYGLPEKVVAAEARAGLSREMVAETIRPSVFQGDQLTRAGEIIIAVPDEAARAPNAGAELLGGEPPMGFEEGASEESQTAS